MSAIYVIELTPGLVKVGCSTSVDRRLAAHRRQARQLFGTEACREWTSPDHGDGWISERRLIAWCAAQQPVRGEYFRLAFEDVVAFAESIPFTTSPPRHVPRDISWLKSVALGVHSPLSGSYDPWPEHSPGLWSFPALERDDPDHLVRLHRDGSMTVSLAGGDAAVLSVAEARAIAAILTHVSGLATQQMVEAS